MSPELSWIILYIAVSAAIILIGAGLLRVLNMRVLLKRRTVFLEVTPPALSDKSALATQHLFSVLHSLASGRTRLERFLDRRKVVSLEVVSSREQGIRYLIQTNESDVTALQQNLISYLPDARYRIHESSYKPEETAQGACFRVLEFRQSRHYAYPLKAQEELTEHDPIAYITGAMTKLEPGEVVALQVVATPYSSRTLASLNNALAHGEEIFLERKLLYFIISRPWVWIIAALTGVIWEPVYGALALCIGLLVSLVIHRNEIPQRSTAEQNLHDQKLAKISQHLFRVDVRAYIEASDSDSCKQKVNSMYASMAPLSVPGYQELYVPRTFPFQLWHRYSLYKYKHRLPSFLPMRSSILAASEMADLYHLPYADSVQTENLVKSHSKTLPAPISLKGGVDFDILLAKNRHHGQVTDIGLTTAERERHVYIIGGTGNGKTTMMLYAMVQDVKNGKGFAFVDPHGDAAETLLKHIPKERLKDVIYFNPDDLAHPIGLNLLELPPGLSGDELLREKDLVTESTISVFRKIFSDEDEGGHRIEYVLRNAIQTALTQEGATLFTIFDLLNDPKYRRQVIGKLQDKDLKNFWQNELGKAGEFQRVKMAAGITAKIGRFLFSASAKRILEQPKSTIDFDDILNSGKILICNFSKGLLGEDTSELFGITVLAKLQMAALRRARIQQADRRAFYLYVDEFQNFATTSFVQMLSEARKYKLFMLMAEQSTSQQEEQRMVQIILANVGAVICFRSANPADEQMLLPLFSPYIEAGEIANLPSFNFYMRISAIRPQEPLSGETVLLADEGSEESAEAVIQQSRRLYAGKPHIAQASQEVSSRDNELATKSKGVRKFQKIV